MVRFTNKVAQNGFRALLYMDKVTRNYFRALLHRDTVAQHGFRALHYGNKVAHNCLRFLLYRNKVVQNGFRMLLYCLKAAHTIYLLRLIVLIIINLGLMPGGWQCPFVRRLTYLAVAGAILKGTVCAGCRTREYNFMTIYLIFSKVFHKFIVVNQHPLPKRPPYACG